MEQRVEYGQPGEQSNVPQFLMPSPTILPLLLAFGLLITMAGVIFHH
jgi:hypothetical protein